LSSTLSVCAVVPQNLVSAWLLVTLTSDGERSVWMSSWGTTPAELTRRSESEYDVYSPEPMLTHSTVLSCPLVSKSRKVSANFGITAGSPVRVTKLKLSITLMTSVAGEEKAGASRLMLPNEEFAVGEFGVGILPLASGFLASYMVVLVTTMSMSVGPIVPTP